MRSSKVKLSLMLSLFCTTAYTQVNNNFVLSPGNAAAGINYPIPLPIPGPANAQPQLNIYANNSNAGQGGESFIECRQAQPVGGSGDFFDITNASGSNALFAPKLTGHAFTHTNTALLVAADIAGIRDVANSVPMITFYTSVGSSRLLNVGAPVVNRPLFGWNNHANTMMMMNSNGDLGIGTGIGAITARLHTIGTVRHEGLPIDSGKVLVIDNNGNVFNSNISSSKIGGVRNSCTTLNIVPKINAANGDLGCSQIFDDGVSVGINSTGPFAYVSGTGVFTAGNPTNQTVRLQVNGLTRSTTFVATSDAKFKTNVSNIENALENVMQLRGVEYEWKVKDYPEKDFDNLKHTGFLAQELMKVLPNSVVKDQNGDYAVDYNAIIPVLANAIQEQQVQIEELKKMLTSSNANGTTGSGNPTTDAVTKGYLSQNVPNPFTQSTVISYQLPANTKTAGIGVYDLNGKEIKLFTLGAEAAGSVIIDGGSMQPGMYVYTLLVNGMPYETKKMVLTSR